MKNFFLTLTVSLSKQLASDIFCHYLNVAMKLNTEYKSNAIWLQVADILFVTNLRTTIM